MTLMGGKWSKTIFMAIFLLKLLGFANRELEDFEALSQYFSQKCLTFQICFPTFLQNSMTHRTHFLVGHHLKAENKLLFAIAYVQKTVKNH